MARPWTIRDLDASQSLPVCLRKALSTRISEMHFYERAVAQADDVEALHDMRVTCRRLEALLTVFRPLFPKKTLRKESLELRRLIKDLGRVREHDVLLHTLRSAATDLPENRLRPLLLMVAREELGRLKALAELRRRIHLLRRKRFEQRLIALASRLG